MRESPYYPESENYLSQAELEDYAALGHRTDYSSLIPVEIEDRTIRSRVLRQRLAKNGLGIRDELLHSLEGLVTEEQRTELRMEQTPGRETHLIRVGSTHRRLATEIVGPEDGSPLVSFHGMPGSRLGRPEDDEQVIAAGFRQYTYDRPGYGFSSELPGRRPVNSAVDVRSLVVTFNLRPVDLIAGSGGCSHALACAAGMPGTIRRVAIIAPTAPLEALGETWYQGMHPRNVDIFRQAFSDDPYHNYRAILALNGLWSRLRSDDPDSFFQKEFTPLSEKSDRSASPSTTGGVRHYRTGYHDDVFGLRDWGFRPQDITQEVLIVYGGQDEFSPPAHGEWLSQNIPNAQGHFLPHATHKETIRAGEEIALDWCSGGQ